MPIKVKDLKKSDLKKLAVGEHSVGHVRGLKLYVRGESNRQWLFRSQCKVCKTMHKISLGAYPEIPWEDAIPSAMRARLLVDEGRCLKQKKEAYAQQVQTVAEQGVTFSMALDKFWPDIKAGKGDKKVEQWRNTLDYYVVPKIGHRAIANLTVRDIYEVLTQSGEAANGDQIDNLWLDRQKVASDIRQRIENIISRSIGYYDLRIANPAAKANGLGPLLPSQAKPVKHHSDLKWEDASEFWKLIEPLESQSAKVLKVLLLTGKRLSEVTGMRWEELDGTLWTIPWQRLLKKQMQVDHREPLTPATLAILADQPNDGGLIFPSYTGKELSDTAIAKIHKRYWTKYPVTTHGLRSAIKTFFYDNDQLGYSRAHVEVILTHGQGALEAAYQRGDGYHRRREMMEIWAAHVTGNGFGSRN